MQAAWQTRQGGQQQATNQAGGSSVSVELQAKLQRQKDAKEKAGLAEQRRREALLAAERAEAEYREAMEAERLASAAATGVAPLLTDSLYRAFLEDRAVQLVSVVLAQVPTA